METIGKALNTPCYLSQKNLAPEEIILRLSLHEAAGTRLRVIGVQDLGAHFIFRTWRLCVQDHKPPTP